jgi:sigma-B regulation protein RsbU (phosphoserine phosphatase)
MFVTVFYGIYDLNTNEIVYCNAGHNPPYILKSNGTVTPLPMSLDPMAGAIDGLEFHSQTCKLEPGDALVMFTDGVTEAMNVDFEEFGEERLERTLETVGGQSCEGINQTVKDQVASFAKGAEQSDDITLLTIKRL